MSDSWGPYSSSHASATHPFFRHAHKVANKLESIDSGAARRLRTGICRVHDFPTLAHFRDFRTNVKQAFSQPGFHEVDPNFSTAVSSHGFPGYDMSHAQDWGNFTKPTHECGHQHNANYYTDCYKMHSDRNYDSDEDNKHLLAMAHEAGPEILREMEQAIHNHDHERIIDLYNEMCTLFSDDAQKLHTVHHNRQHLQNLRSSKRSTSAPMC